MWCVMGLVLSEASRKSEGVYVACHGPRLERSEPQKRRCLCGVIALVFRSSLLLTSAWIVTSKSAADSFLSTPGT